MEELVSQHLRRLRSLLWIVAQHPFHEADGFGRCTRHYRLQIDLLVLRHGEKLAVGEALRIRPVLIARLAQNHGNLMELVHLRRARE